MLIDLNGTPLISGRHSGGGSETAMLLLQPGSHGGQFQRQFRNVAEEQELEQEQERDENPEPEPGIVPVPNSMEHQIQARLLVVDKRLHQAMYNTS